MATVPFWVNSHEGSSRVTEPAGIAEFAETNTAVVLVLSEALRDSSWGLSDMIELETEPVEP